MALASSSSKLLHRRCIQSMMPVEMPRHTSLQGTLRLGRYFVRKDNAIMALASSSSKLLHRRCIFIRDAHKIIYVAMIYHGTSKLLYNSCQGISCFCPLYMNALLRKFFFVGIHSIWFITDGLSWDFSMSVNEHAPKQSSSSQIKTYR